MSKKKVSSNVVFESINVDSISNLSGVFVGNNSQWFWKSQNKSNTAFGAVDGENNFVLKPLNLVIDPDNVDNPTIDKGGQNGGD
ncbi:hypothetical protein [Sporohalobacter salinus]|uniref:hypothetical protein n=1 Tax=Sporohalobacter salinus TaxID=1494606 RepID=UPI0019609BE0|nr:hypothetical protein [Sporohalobacter salinus]MBM7624455.1 hypothetical protein [Sporohalobacter salinus]